MLANVTNLDTLAAILGNIATVLIAVGGAAKWLEHRIKKVTAAQTAVLTGVKPTEKVE